MPMRLGAVEINGAYMQRGLKTREIYVRLPNDSQRSIRKTLLKLLKLSHEVVGAGRQWKTVIERCLINEMGMEQAKGISQLFIKRRNDGSISMLLAKITDGFLITGDLLTLNEFVERLITRFQIRKAIIDSPINFHGCRIQKDEDGNVKINMDEYLNQIETLSITRYRRKEDE